MANAPTPPHQSLGRSHKPVIVSNSCTQEEHRAHTGRSRAPRDASKMHGTTAFYTCGYAAQHKHRAEDQGPLSSPSGRHPAQQRAGCTTVSGTPEQLPLLAFGFFPLNCPSRGFVLHFCICFILNINGKVREQIRNGTLSI